MSRNLVPFTVMNYLLTTAALDGTAETATVRVPYADLLALVGRNVESKEEIENAMLDLVVKISLEWDEHIEDDEQAVEMDIDFKEGSNE